VSFKDVAGMARAALASALMFLSAALVPIAGGALMAFAPAPLLGYAVGLPHALGRISAAIAFSTAVVAGGGGMGAGAAYLATFGLSAAVMCYMLERRMRFEVIVFGATAAAVLAGTATALGFAGSVNGLVMAVHNELVAGMNHGQSFYKALGVDVALAPDSQTYVVDTIMRLIPALIGLLGALMVLLNLAIFWRWSGRQQRVGYTLFDDMGRWSTPEWFIWPLLVSGFGWFIPIPAIATIALNCFVCMLAIYFCQGLAIMSFYFKRLGMPALARGLIYFVTMAQPVLTALVGAAGIFDLWVDFRRLKPPDATARNLKNFS
jgi:uncharacterized protein YybS (DUF2232 family)